MKMAQGEGRKLVGLTITLMISPMRPLTLLLMSDRLQERMQEGSQPTTSQANVGQFERGFSPSMLKCRCSFSILPSHQCFQVLISAVIAT